jgi:hypothetical protein
MLSGIGPKADLNALGVRFEQKKFIALSFYNQINYLYSTRKIFFVQIL